MYKKVNNLLFEAKNSSSLQKHLKHISNDVVFLKIMTAELKNGQIVGIVSPDRFPGCNLDIEIAKVTGHGPSSEFIIDKKSYGFVLSRDNIRKDGIQYTFPELAPVLCSENVGKKIS